MINHILTLDGNKCIIQFIIDPMHQSKFHISIYPTWKVVTFEKIEWLCLLVYLSMRFLFLVWKIILMWHKGKKVFLELFSDRTHLLKKIENCGLNLLILRKHQYM